MQAVLDVALPVFAIIALGHVAGVTGLLGDAATRALNAFVYWFALPPLLFLAMARLPIDDIFNGPFLIAYSGGVLGTFALSMIAGLLVFPNRPAALTLQGMTAVFANTGYMGVPLFIAAVGEARALPALILTVYNAAIVIGATVVLIELDIKAGSNPLRIVGGVLGALARNPLVVTPLAGIAYGAAGPPLPTPVVNFAEILGAAAGPCALFAMGLSLVGKSLRRGLGEVGWLVALKLLVQPAITWWLAFRVLHLPPFWASSAVILAALPTGALAFVLAQRYDLYVQRATSVTLISTVLSVVTVSALLAWLPFP